MKKFYNLKENEKAKEVVENAKKNKKKIILIGAGGVLLLVGGYFIGKKIGKGNAIGFTTQFGSIVRDTIVTNPIPLPEETTSIWEQIDEEVFTDIALEMENALCDLNINDLHIDRSWDVAEGVTKKLAVTIETISA